MKQNQDALLNLFNGRGILRTGFGSIAWCFKARGFGFVRGNPRGKNN